MPAAGKESASEISVMSLILNRIEEIATHTSVLSTNIGQAITEIRKEVNEIDVQVATVATKLDSVIKTLGHGDDGMASTLVNLQTRVATLEQEVQHSRDQTNRVKMALINSFLFPIFVGVICSVVGWIFVRR